MKITVRKQGLSYISGENVSWYNLIFEGHFFAFYENKKYICLLSEQFILSNLPWDILPSTQSKQSEIYTRLFIMTLFIVTNDWKQTKYPSVESQLNKLWYIYTFEFVLTWVSSGRGSSLALFLFVLLQSVVCCVVLCCVVCPQSCLTCCNPVDCSPPGFSVHGILQARTVEWVAISFSRGFSQCRDWTCVSYISCLGRQILNYGTTWEALSECS